MLSSFIVGFVPAEKAQAAECKVDFVYILDSSLAMDTTNNYLWRWAGDRGISQLNVGLGTRFRSYANNHPNDRAMLILASGSNVPTVVGGWGANSHSRVVDNMQNFTADRGRPNMNKALIAASDYARQRNQTTGNRVFIMTIGGPAPAYVYDKEGYYGEEGKEPVMYGGYGDGNGNFEGFGHGQPPLSPATQARLREDSTNPNIIYYSYALGSSNMLTPINAATYDNLNLTVHPYQEITNLTGGKLFTWLRPDEFGALSMWETSHSLNQDRKGCGNETGAAKISGYKYLDKNGNSQRDADEKGLGGWKISLVDESNNVVAGPYVTEATGNAGYFEFTQLDPNKKYKVTEEMQSGWAATQNDEFKTPAEKAVRALGNKVASCTPGTPDCDPPPPPPCARREVVCELSGIKFEDKNANGTREAGENGLGKWKFQLLKQENGTFEVKKQVESSNVVNKGSFKFDDALFAELGSGAYKIREVRQDGWKLTNPAIESQVFLMPQTGRKTDIQFANNKLTDGQIEVGSKTGSPNPLPDDQNNFKVKISIRVVGEAVENVTVKEALAVGNHLDFAPGPGGKPVVLLNNVAVAADKITLDKVRPTQKMEINLGSLAVGNYSLTFDTVYNGPPGVYQIDDKESTIEYISKDDHNPYKTPIPPGNFVKLPPPTRDLAIRIEPVAREAAAGQQITYQLFVTNIGKGTIPKGQRIDVTLRSPKGPANADMLVNATLPSSREDATSINSRTRTWHYPLPSDLDSGKTLSQVFSVTYTTRLSTNTIYNLLGCVKVDRDINTRNDCQSSKLTMREQSGSKTWSDTKSTATRTFEPGQRMPFKLTIRNTSSQSKTYDLTDQVSFSCESAPQCSTSPAWDGSIASWQVPADQNWTISADKSTLQRNNVTIGAGQSVDMSISAQLPDAATLSQIVREFGQGERCNTLNVKERGIATTGVPYKLCWKYNAAPPPSPVSVIKSLLSSDDVEDGESVDFRIDVVNNETKAQSGKTWYITDELNSLFDAGYALDASRNSCEVIAANGNATVCKTPGQQTNPTLNPSNNRQLTWQVRDIPAGGKISYWFTTRISASAGLSECPTNVDNIAYLTDNTNDPRQFASGPASIKVYLGNCIKGNIHARNQSGDTANGNDGIVINGSDVKISANSILSSTGTVDCTSNDSCTFAPWKVSGYDTNESEGIKFSKIVTRFYRNIQRLLERSNEIASDTLTGNFNLLTGYGKNLTITAKNSADYPDGRVWVHYGDLTIDKPLKLSGRGTLINYGNVRITGDGSIDYPDQSKTHSFGLIVLPNNGNGGNLIVDGSPRIIKGAYYVPGTATDVVPNNSAAGTINFQNGSSLNRLIVNGLFIAREFKIERQRFSLEYDPRTTDTNTAPPGFTFTSSPSDTQERS